MIALGVVLVLVAVGLVLAHCLDAESSCDLPNEPWLEWDGEDPEELT